MSKGTRLLLYLSVYSIYVFLSRYWKRCGSNLYDTSAYVNSMIWIAKISLVCCFGGVQWITNFQQSVLWNSFKIARVCSMEPSVNLQVFWFKLLRKLSHTLLKLFPQDPVLYSNSWTQLEFNLIEWKKELKMRKRGIQVYSYSWFLISHSLCGYVACLNWKFQAIFQTQEIEDLRQQVENCQY